jgi:ferrochelatase
MTVQKKTGVVLLQLGGPDSLDTVEPFLYNLFCDPDIIDLPLASLFRKPLARFISRRRAPKVQEYYRRIGKRSPLLKITRRQAAALHNRLRPALEAKVYIAMRYWHPMTDAVADEIRRDGITDVILLPLYPQYSVATTGSSVHEWERVVQAKRMNEVSTMLVEHYYDHPLYIEAIVRNIRIALKRVRSEDREKVHILFSAHGTPVKLVKRGDPYARQIRATCEAVIEAGRFNLPHSLCYQSKVGPEKWLEPSLDDTVVRLGKERVTHVIVVPVAFVSDHVETLWEINIETREEAHHAGIRHFDIMPALNTNPFFIEALADLVRSKVAA